MGDMQTLCIVKKPLLSSFVIGEQGRWQWPALNDVRPLKWSIFNETQTVEIFKHHKEPYVTTFSTYKQGLCHGCDILTNQTAAYRRCLKNLFTSRRCINRHLPYSGKFLYGANFCKFRMSVLYAKIKTTKIWTIGNFMWTLPLQQLVWYPSNTSNI